MKKNKDSDTNQTIERLVEFKIKRNELKLTKKKPVDLILEEGSSRNWEAIARLGESGFLIATDKYPRMIFGMGQNRTPNYGKNCRNIFNKKCKNSD